MHIDTKTAQCANSQNLKNAKKRILQIDTILKNLYEDKVLGNINLQLSKSWNLIIYETSRTQ